MNNEVRHHCWRLQCDQMLKEKVAQIHPNVAQKDDPVFLLKSDVFPKNPKSHQVFGPHLQENLSSRTF